MTVSIFRNLNLDQLLTSCIVTYVRTIEKLLKRFTKMAKTYTITKTRTRTGSERDYTGTVEELTKVFAYTLDCGNSYNPKINTKPKTVKGLLTALDKSVQETQGSCYYPDRYEIKETV